VKLGSFGKSHQKQSLLQPVIFFKSFVAALFLIKKGCLNFWQTMALIHKVVILI